jgi:hypothetical protein
MAGMFHGEFGASTRTLNGLTILTGTDAAIPLTAAQSINSVVTIPASTSRAVTTASGPDIIAALDEFRIGSSFEVTVVNTGAGAVTFTANATGATVTGLATVASNTSGTFVGRVATATTVIYYRR